MAGERTEEPTRKRVQDARQRGQVVRSREVDSAIVLLAGFGVLRFGGAAMWNGMADLLVDSFAMLEGDPLTMDLTAVMGVELFGRVLMILAPLFVAIAGLALLGGIGQTGGPLFATEAVKPQLKRMNPASGAKRLFASKHSYVEMAKSTVKLMLIGGVAAFALWQRWEEVAALGVAYSFRGSLGLIVDVAFDVTLQVTLVVVVLAVADYLFQRYDLMGQLRMTKQEVKDELRQSDGDPQVKGQMARARRSLLNRVMQAVPEADVVLVNPTHFAVALKYDPTAHGAPVVVAKGADLIAARIREVAEEHRIPVVTNPPLTRAVYAAVPIGREITPELYEAVAEVLAFVFRLRSGGFTRQMDDSRLGARA